jgi:glutamine amidotransferase
MCRLFGFRSVIDSQVHSSLVGADNALIAQSQEHPDGWGVAYYVDHSPHLIKSENTAINCQLFQRLSGIVASQTVIAHLRKATIGNKIALNTHPFQHGHWVFAHNGNIKGFSEIRQKLLLEVAPGLRRYILGDTDSEIIFFLILTQLKNRFELSRKGCSIEDLAASARDSVAIVEKLAGPYNTDENGDPLDTYLTFIITDGATMLAHHGGKPLHYSTYKTRCQDRDSCPSFAPECEKATTTGFVNHLIFSSEPLKGENIWLAMKPGNMVGVDWRMELKIYP